MEASDGSLQQAGGLLGLFPSERVGEECAGECVPGELRILQSLDEPRICLEPVDRGCQRDAPAGRIDVPGELEDGGIVEGRLPVQIPAGGEHEQRAPKRRVALALVERNLPTRDVCEDDELGVVSRRGQAAYSSAIASASSRIPIPSSISSRVIVSGGQTMITFQCVMR